MKIKKMSQKTKHSYIEMDESLVPYDNKTSIFKYRQNDSFEGFSFREKIDWNKIKFITKIRLKTEVDFLKSLQQDYNNLYRIRICCLEFIITLYFKDQLAHERIFNTLKEKIKKQETINLDKLSEL